MKNIIALFVLLFTGMSISVNAQNLKKTGKEKAVHIVLFKFKEGTTVEQIQSLKNEILKQKGMFRGYWKSLLERTSRAEPKALPMQK